MRFIKYFAICSLLFALPSLHSQEDPLTFYKEVIGICDDVQSGKANNYTKEDIETAMHSLTRFLKISTAVLGENAALEQSIEMLLNELRNLSSVTNEEVLDEFLNNLSLICDANYQRRIWLRGECSECPDPSTTINTFFDGVEYFLDDAQSNITEAQHRLLSTLRDELKDFSNVNQGKTVDQELLSSSEWRNIIDIAKEVLEAFNY